jgi:hypothetical protein
MSAHKMGQHERDRLTDQVETWLDELAEVAKVSKDKPYLYGRGGKMGNVGGASSSQKAMLEIGIKLATARLAETVRGELLEAIYTEPPPEAVIKDVVKIQEVE